MSNIEGKLVAHDRHQFELKLGYTLNPSLTTNRYHIELYMFVPRSLNINRQAYSKRHFFSDMRGYIRFKTPAFTFDGLVDPDNVKSPLTRIKGLADKPDKERLIAELKLYACTVRVALRDAITEARRRLKNKEQAGIGEFVSGFCRGAAGCLTAMRELSPKLSSPQVHEDVKRAYRMTDEYLGIILDDLLNSINSSVVNSELDEGLKKELSGIIMPVIVKEQDYRRERNYITYSKGSENELFLYRKGLLKKVTNSILFLETHTVESLSRVRELVFAIAAGIAMVIAAIVMVWAGRRWSTTSMPFVLALVIGYILKDRIKDWLKVVFSRRMTRWLADYKTEILDPETGRKIGVCRHAFSFIPENRVPAGIATVRMQGHSHSMDFWIPEEVIKYEKEVMLKPRPIIRAHTRLSDITDIIRFNVHRFLDAMDEPYEVHRVHDPSAKSLSEFTCARVYHINLVLKLADRLRRLRLVVDQNGLKRVEEVRFTDEASFIP